MFEDNQSWPQSPEERSFHVQDKLLGVLLSSDLQDPIVIGKAVFLAHRAALLVNSEESLEGAREVANFFLQKIIWCVDYYKAQQLKNTFGIETLEFWETNVPELPDNVEDRQRVLETNRRTNEVITKLMVEVEKNAITDMLTGLYNRRYFVQSLESLIERANRYDRQSFALLMFDIDHFKNFNDTYGHQTGDDALRVVAELLKDALRKTDTAARFGGEEFICLLPMTSVQGAMIFAERLRKDVERFPFIVEIEDEDSGYKMNHVSITISIGIAEFRPGQRAEEIVKQADKALYFAKENGRNRIEVIE